MDEARDRSGEEVFSIRQTFPPSWSVRQLSMIGAEDPTEETGRGREGEKL